MTDADIVKHWREGAQRELHSAQVLSDAGDYANALFHCHLGIEKALKAEIMEKTQKPHPKIHELSALAKLVKSEWSGEDRELFEALSDFAIAARYDDPAWAQNQATAENTQKWIEKSGAFLSGLLP